MAMKEHFIFLKDPGLEYHPQILNDTQNTPKCVNGGESYVSAERLFYNPSQLGG